MPDAVRVEPIAGALGAEIGGVSLAGDLSNSDFDAIHDAFLKHHVIFFRDQHDLTPEAHKSFGQRFGSLNVHPYVSGMDEHPEIIKQMKTFATQATDDLGNEASEGSGQRAAQTLNTSRPMMMLPDH